MTGNLSEDLRVSVVYPTRDRAHFLRRSLEALLANERLPDEIVVADQSRTDETRRLVAGFNDPRLVHVPSGETGLSRGRNAGIRASRFPIVGFLDDDCIPAKGWVSSAVETILRFPASSVFIGEVFRNEDDDPNKIPAGLPETLLHLKGVNDPWRLGPTGGNSFFRKCVFEKVGLFDPLLGQGSDFPGAEDGDMVYRVLRHGLRATYSNTIRCVHLGWRNDAENIQNGYNYGMGVGAMLAKHAALGDYYPIGVIFPRRFLFRYLSLPCHLALGRSKNFQRNLKWCQGIAEGFRKWPWANESLTK